MNARQPFCWWMTFTKVSNPFLPSPPKWLTWPLDVCGGVGYGWLYWFGLYGRTFSQTSLELEILSSTSNGVTIFFRIIRHERYFFQCRIFFSQEFICMLFSSRNQSAGYFLKSSITPSKVKWSASKIQQTFGRLTDSNLSIISKGFWNNRGQNSPGERGGIRFYLPLPGKFVRTYGDVITKFSLMDFITHGAPPRRLRYNTFWEVKVILGVAVR